MNTPAPQRVAELQPRPLAAGSAHDVPLFSKRTMGNCQPGNHPTPSPLRFDEGDQVGTLLVLLNTGEHHLRAGNVLLGVDQVFEHVLLRPMNGCVLVRLRVAETLTSARGATKDAPQGWPLLRIAAFLDGVALCAFC